GGGADVRRQLRSPAPGHARTGSAPRSRPGGGAGPMTTTGMDATHLKIVYGGHTAVSDFTFSAPVGRISGLIGPNGAGKTSIFNACNGLLRPASGTVELFGADVTHWSPARRARHGLGRTFQRM